MSTDATATAELPPELKCFFEEIGHQIGSDVKIFETECGNEAEAVTAPKYCPHCQRTVEIAPGCRRCGSTEHTTSYHDARLVFDNTRVR
jgi:hypothetical protein